ncbi:hypothetical protein [Peribacillus sp. SCS-155]|uniref:hypothetical protein n=1 Tax=Peribacillus sedimenti TaxID=3115297 RepID=UPI0039058024
MIDINMRVRPSFYDEECAIVFSFYFHDKLKKLGEAIIYTCEAPVGRLVKNESVSRISEKVAYIKEFTIVKEYEALSLEKIKQFLKMCGIKTCFLQQEERTKLAN